MVFIVDKLHKTERFNKNFMNKKFFSSPDMPKWNMSIFSDILRLTHTQKEEKSH